MKKYLYLLIVALFATMSFVSCGGNGSSQQSTQDTISNHEREEQPSVKQWVYSDNGKRASLMSTNQQSCNDYASGYLLMNIEQNNNGNIVFFGVVDENGSKIKSHYEFTKGPYTQYTRSNAPFNTSVRVSFGDGKDAEYNVLSSGEAIAIMDQSEVADFVQHLTNSNTCEVAVIFSDRAKAASYRYDYAPTK